MYYPLARFVDAIGSDTIRLDLNDGTFRIGDATKGEAFGQPDWDAEPGDVGGEDGYRVTSLQVLCGADKRAAAAAYHRLALELQRPTNIIYWQDSPDADPRWIRVYRSQLPVLSYEWVGADDHPDGGEDVWSVTLELTSDPYAYGRPITLHRNILNYPAKLPRATTAINLSPNPSFEVSDRGWAGGQRRLSGDAVAGAWVYGIPEGTFTLTNWLPNPGYETSETAYALTNNIHNPLPVSAQGWAASGGVLTFVGPGQLRLRANGGAACYARTSRAGGLDGSAHTTVPCGVDDVVRVSVDVTAPADMEVRIVAAWYDAAGANLGGSVAGSYVPIAAGETKSVVVLATAAVANTASMLPLIYIYAPGHATAVPAGTEAMLGHHIVTVNETLPPWYVDGNTPDINGVYDWLGTPDYSASTAVIYTQLDRTWTTPNQGVSLIPETNDWPGLMGSQSAALRRADGAASDAVATLRATPTVQPVALPEEGTGGESQPTLRARVTVGRGDTSSTAPAVPAAIEATFTDADGAQVGETLSGPATQLSGADQLVLDAAAPVGATDLELSVRIDQGPQPTPTVNRIVNPSLTINSQGWNPQNAQLVWRAPGDAEVIAPGGAQPYFYATGAVSGAGSYHPVQPGQRVRVRYRLRGGDTDVTIRAALAWYNANNASTSVSAPIWVDIPAGAEKTIVLDGIAAADAASTLPLLYLYDADRQVPPAGTNVHVCSGQMTVDQPLLDDEWDGDTFDTPTALYRWAGTPYASRSIYTPSEQFLIDGWVLTFNQPAPAQPFDGDSPSNDAITYAWTGDRYDSPSTATGSGGLLWQWSTDSFGDLWLTSGWSEDQTWTLSANVAGFSEVPFSVVAGVRWIDLDNNVIAAADAAPVTVRTGPVRVSVTSARPADAVRARFTLTGNATGAYPAQPWMDAVMFEASATLNPYRDGDSSGWAWTGTRGLSTSGPLDPEAGRPAYAILGADLVQGDGPAELQIRMQPSAPWHVIEPLLQLTAFETTSADAAPIVVAFSTDPDAATSGFSRSASTLWRDLPETQTWANTDPDVSWDDL